MEDVQGLRQYAWAEVVWHALVESIEDIQKKLLRGDVPDVQMNGFTFLIEVCLCE